MRIVITDYVINPDVELSVLGEGASIECLNNEDETTFPQLIEEADALLVWHARITEKTISRLKKCKAIVRYGVGFDSVDYKCAQRYGIPFCNTPDYGIHEVADTACGMILALIRKIFSYNHAAQRFSSGWQEHTQPPIKRSTEHNLGIIGIGRIGSAVALRMKAFGIKIGFYDPYVPSGYEKAIGVQRFDLLKDLLRFSSIISLHLPLSDETKGMVDKNFIQSLNDNTIFINTARGKIVKNLDVLYDGLVSNKLAAVGLDVLPNEPPLESERLIQAWKDTSSELHPRIIINPHTSYFSDMAWREMREKAAENVRNILQGRPPKNLVV
jgi:D-3-phosphoglycerate dehydrogenase